MLSKIDHELAFIQPALDLRARRQEVLASNIANSDTPNYKARDIDFSAALQSAMGSAEAGGAVGGGLTLNRSDPRHLDGVAGATDATSRFGKFRSAVQPSLDGNTVDINVERAQFADNAMHYQFMLDRAQGVFRDLTLAIQPVK